MTVYSILHWLQPSLVYFDDSLLCLTMVTVYSILHWLQPSLVYFDDSLLYFTLVTAFFSLL